MFSFGTVCLSWIALNLAPDYKRSMGVPLQNMLGSTAGVLASQIYPGSQGPRYISGNAISLSMEVVALIGVVCMYTLLRYRNAQKQKLRDQGVESNGKIGDRALDFDYLL